MIKNAALASLFAVSAVLAQGDNGLHIDTPNGPVACQPTRITWGGGQPPYYVTIMKGGESAGTPLADLTGGNPTSETSLTWWVNLEPNTEITATIKDSTGQQNAAARVTVSGGGNLDCLQKPLSVSIAGGMQTASGTSGSDTPKSTDSGSGGGVVGGGSSGQQSQGGGDQQASQTPSATEGGGASESSAPSGSESGGASESAAPSGSESGGAGGASQSESPSASPSAGEQSGSSAAPTSSAPVGAGGAGGASSQSAPSGGNASPTPSGGASAGAASSASHSGASASHSATPSGGKSGASALIPGFVAPALAAVVAVFAL